MTLFFIKKKHSYHFLEFDIFFMIILFYEYFILFAFSLNLDASQYSYYSGEHSK